MVAASNYLNIIQVVRIDSWKTNTTVVHLTSENFISEEVVSPETSITVSEVVRFGHSNIRKISKKSVHAIVLLLYIVKVFSVLINSV